MSVTFATKPPLFDRAVFVDGLTRSAKKLTCKIISHFERVDYFQYYSGIENYCYMWFAGALDEAAAVPFLQFAVDEHTYNRAIGRYLNTRFSDETSIYKAPNPDSYVTRTTLPDGMEAVERYRAAQRIPLFTQHDLLPMAQIVFKALPYAQIVNVNRHPVDLTMEWHLRGWGRRETDDPLSFVPVLDTSAGNVPWFAKGWEDRYMALNPMERAVESILALQEADDSGYAALTAEQQDQVLRIPYEATIERTDETVGTLCAFLGTEALPKLKPLMAAERLPSPLPVAARAEKLERIEAEIGAQTRDALRVRTALYEDRWSLPPCTG